MFDAAQAATGPGERGGLPVGAGPLVGLQVSLSNNLWRIGPAWAVLAGALASGAPLSGGDALLRLAGAIGLADSAWGIMWQLTAGSAHGQAQADGAVLRVLPYAQWHAPAARIASRLQGLAATRTTSGASSAGWHGLAVGLALTLILSLLLGSTALVLSLVTLLVIFVAWMLAQHGVRPALCHALLNVGLPWALGAALAGRGSAALITKGQITSLVLAAAFVVLQWGVMRAYLSDCSRARGVWLGQGILLAVLGGLQQPWALAVVAGLLLPPAWWLLQARETVAGWPIALTRSAPWWWAALLLSAVALR